MSLSHNPCWLSGSPTTGEEKKNTHRDWKEGHRHWTGWSDTYMCCFLIWRRAALGSHPWGARGPTSPCTFQHRIPELGREVSVTTGWKTNPGHSDVDILQICFQKWMKKAFNSSKSTGSICANDNFQVFKQGRAPYPCGAFYFFLLDFLSIIQIEGQKTTAFS